MNDYLFKSREHNGIRCRALRLKEKDRWEFHGLELLSNQKFYFDYIYTLEQAIEKNIYFREDWRNPKPDTEKVYFGDNVYCQREDWVVTELPDSHGEMWVMRVLWRNEHQSFPHIKTAVGTFCTNRHSSNKPFTGDDVKSQYSQSGKTEYSNGKLNARQEILVVEVARLILEKGYFSKEIMKIAYRSVYSVYPNWQKVVKLLRSDKIMSAVANELKDKLKDKKVDIDWVAEQLKEMGSKDYDKAPERRLEVVKLVARIHGDVIDTHSPEMLNGSHVRAIEADFEVQEDLEKLGIEDK